MIFLARTILVSYIVFFNFGTSHAAEDNSLPVHGGKLVITGESGEKKLLLNDKLLRDSDGFSLSFEKKFAVGNKDVVLIMNNSGGTACPVQYFFVTVTSQGVTKLSPEFGSCSDLAKPIKKGTKIIVTMPKMTGRGNDKYVYYNGILTENGQPIQDTTIPSVVDTGEVMINGRGQVLTSGNPDRKVLQCVQDRVEKEKSFSEGWDDRIISECNNN